MSTQETTDLRALPGAQLRGELDDSMRALFNLRFRAATRQLADVSQVRGARRRVARIKTLLREREILVELGELDPDETPVAAAEQTVEPPSDEAEAAAEDVAGDEPEEQDEETGEDETEDEATEGDEPAAADEDGAGDGDDEDRE